MTFGEEVKAGRGWYGVGAFIVAGATIVVLELAGLVSCMHRNDLTEYRERAFEACVNKADEKAAITTVEACSRIARETIQ